LSDNCCQLSVISCLRQEAGGMRSERSRKSEISTTQSWLLALGSWFLLSVVGCPITVNR